MNMNMMRVEMFIPRIPYAAVESLVSEIISECGGMTRTTGVGYWQSTALGDVQAEGVWVLIFFCGDDEDNRLWVETIAREYKEAAQQECVLYVINGNNTFFIED